MFLGDFPFHYMFRNLLTSSYVLVITYAPVFIYVPVVTKVPVAPYVLIKSSLPANILIDMDLGAMNTSLKPPQQVLRYNRRNLISIQ